MPKLLSILDIHNTDFLVILVSFSILSLSTFTFLWFYNRKKFQTLEHELPAEVVKSYIDSIIHNSNVLKSSLFRGEVSPTDFQSTMNSVNVQTKVVEDTKSLEEIERLKELLNSNEASLNDTENRLSSSENALSESSDKIKALEAKIEELLNAPAEVASTDNSEVDSIQAKLDETEKEKELLRERLQEYEIIEDDLANLKRLQQENALLKESLAKSSVSMPEVASAAPVEAEPLESSSLAHVEPIINDPVEESMAAVDTGSDSNEEEISDNENSPEEEIAAAVDSSEESSLDSDPDDLLREFEKMLG